MPVTAMQVGIMRALVQQRRVPVSVTMGLADRIGRRMVVVMVDVMHLAMLMLEWGIRVVMIVRPGEVKIDANPHQQRGTAPRQKGGGQGCCR